VIDRTAHPALGSITLVSPSAHYAGHYWRVTQTLAQALAAEGVAVEVIVPTSPAGGGAMPAHIYHSLPRWWHRLTSGSLLGLPRSWKTTLFHNLETLACALRALPGAMSESGGLVHFLGGTHIFICLLALCSRRPVFVSIYGDFAVPNPVRPSLKERFRDWLLQRLVRQHKLVIIAETDSLRDRWRWLFGEDIHTIPYAISIPAQRESTATARAALGLPMDVSIFLLFGTQREGKDYGVVLRAARLIEPAVHLLFVGKIISHNNPQALAAQCGFTQATFIDRFVDEEEVSRFFHAADAVVLPYEEGFDRGSGVIVDACGFGRPIIASRTGYLQWFVETHQVGLLYRPGDAVDLAQVFQQFLALNSTDRAQLDAHVRRAADLHSWPLVIQTYLRLYRRYHG
jgi:glycosyltransferase involved in cell wall biosynthesis